MPSGFVLLDSSAVIFDVGRIAREGGEAGELEWKLVLSRVRNAPVTKISPRLSRLVAAKRDYIQHQLMVF